MKRIKENVELLFLKIEVCLLKLKLRFLLKKKEKLIKQCALEKEQLIFEDEGSIK